MIIVGITVAVLAIFLISLRSSSDPGSGTAFYDEEKPVQKVSDDEEEGVQYNYMYFHLMCFLASLYIMMVMTNWLKPDIKQIGVKKGFVFVPSLASVWVQIVSSWLCLALYAWTLVAPIACPNRSFGWIGNQDE